jgi:hypothetical protein
MSGRWVISRTCFMWEPDIDERGDSVIRFVHEVSLLVCR